MLTESGFSVRNSRATISSGKVNPEIGNIVSGAFTPVLAKHSMSFSLIDCLSVGVIEVVALYDAARSSSVRMQMVVAIRVAYVKTSWVGPLRADEHSESLQSWAT